MKNLLLFIIALSFLFTSFIIPGGASKIADKEIAKFYGTSIFVRTVISLSKEDNERTLTEFGQENLFKITSKDKFLGYGYIGKAPSKTASFDYLVLFDKDLIIEKSAVLVYRDNYGGEISSEQWLSQFEGIAAGSEELIDSQGIIPISGATISVRSMTQAINELLANLAILQKSNSI